MLTGKEKESYIVVRLLIYVIVFQQNKEAERILLIKKRSTFLKKYLKKSNKRRIDKRWNPRWFYESYLFDTTKKNMWNNFLWLWCNYTLHTPCEIESMEFFWVAIATLCIQCCRPCWYGLVATFGPVVLFGTVLVYNFCHLRWLCPLVCLPHFGRFSHLGQLHHVAICHFDSFGQIATWCNWPNQPISAWAAALYAKCRDCHSKKLHTFYFTRCM